MAREHDNTTFADTSFLDGANASYLEALQARYEAAPDSVDAQWRAFFEAMADERAAATK